VLVRYTTGPRKCKRTTRLERASPGWRPGALPSELRPREHARLESNQRLLPSQDSALSTELRACEESLRQESNPHLSRTKSACLPLTLRRLVCPSHRFAGAAILWAEWRRRESNPLLLGASEVLYRQSFIPKRLASNRSCSSDGLIAARANPAIR
jgi:hypothetical protein